MPARLLCAVPLMLLVAGCAPTTLLDNPVNWPEAWVERSLWTTPNAHIYASRAAAAGEVDRLVARTAREYEQEVGTPPPRPVIIVRDRGEALPVDDVNALVASAVRVTVRREVESADDDAEASTRASAALEGLLAGAGATGMTLEAFMGGMPLSCDQRCLREVVRAPHEILENVDGVLILSTRAALGAHVHRLVDSACKQYGIGPVARVLGAPLIAIVEAKSVDVLAKSRDVALLEHWVFGHAGLSWEKKRELAAAYRERLLGELEAGVTSVERAVRGTEEIGEASEEQE